MTSTLSPEQFAREFDRFLDEKTEVVVATRIHTHCRRQVGVSIDYTPLAKYAGCGGQVALSVAWWLTSPPLAGTPRPPAGHLRSAFSPIVYAAAVERRLDSMRLRTTPPPTTPKDSPNDRPDGLANSVRLGQGT